MRAGARILAAFGLFPLAVALRAAPGPPPCPGFRPASLSLESGSPDRNSIAVADFNLDGHADLAVGLDAHPPALAVFLADSEGRYADPEVIELPGALHYGIAIGAGDFDNDGWPDVAFSGHGTLWFVLGQSGGGFRPPISADLPSDSAWIEVADFDGNGRSEAVAGYTHAAYDPAGRIVLAAFVGPSFGVYDVTAGDFDRDGKPDLAWAGTSNLAVQRSLGEGEFAPPETYVTGETGKSIIAGDLSGDGKLDLLIGVQRLHDLSSVLIYLGDGSGEFQPSADVRIEPGVGGGFDGGSAEGLALADFDSDGLPDIAVSDGLLGLFLLRGAGGGGFVQTGPFPAGRRPGKILTADLDGDDRLDLAIPDANGSVTLLYGDPVGIFSFAPEWEVGRLPRSAAVGDFDGDGTADLAVGNHGDGTTSLFRGLPSGGLAAPVLLEPPESGSYSLAAGDFRGIGRDDLAGADNSGHVTLFAFSGTGPNGVVTTITVGEAGSGTHQVASADLNRDGRAELVVVGTALITVLRSDDAGAFSPLTTFVPDFAAISCALGDLNGDAFPDLVVTNLAAVARAYLGNGDGTFAAAGTVYFEDAFGSVPVLILDVDRDGKGDIVIAKSDRGEVKVFLGNGNGTFRPGPDLAVARGSVSSASADFDGDTIPDLALAYAGAGSVAVFRGTGTGAFVASEDLTVAGDPTFVVAHDFTDDGSPDLAALGAQFDLFHGSVTLLVNACPDRGRRVTTVTPTRESRVVGRN